MKIAATLLSIFFLLSTLNAQNYQSSILKIDSIIADAMTDYGVPGFSLAIVKDEAVLYKMNYGKANIEHNVPLTDKSIFRVYSITKIFAAVGIMKLIEDGKVQLTDPLSKYTLDIPTSWKNREIQHLLSYTSGFPDMAPIPEFQELTEIEAFSKVSSSPLLFEAGTHYSYNQTNFYILQKIIEEVSGKTFREFIIEHQFSAGNENAFISIDSRDIIANRVTPYFPFATGERKIDHSYLQGSFFDACTGMNITLDEFIKWDFALRNNSFINETSKMKMLSEVEYTENDRKFTLGWDKTVLNQHPSFGFSGSLVTAYRIFPDDSLSIILLSNGLDNLYHIEDIINDIANAIDPDIKDQNKIVVKNLLALVEMESLSSYSKYFKKVMGNPELAEVELESIGNSIGYQLLRNKNYKMAIDVFKVNVKHFPDSWNVYDSLGEAYMNTDNKVESIQNYKKSLVLNPENQNGKEALKKLEGL